MNDSKVRDFVFINNLQPPHKIRLLRFLRNHELTHCFTTAVIEHRDVAIIEKRHLREIIDTIGLVSPLRRKQLEDTLDELFKLFLEEQPNGSKNRLK